MLFWIVMSDLIPRYARRSAYGGIRNRKCFSFRARVVYTVMVVRRTFAELPSVVLAIEHSTIPCIGLPTYTVMLLDFYLS